MYLFARAALLLTTEPSFQSSPLTFPAGWVCWQWIPLGFYLTEIFSFTYETILFYVQFKSWLCFQCFKYLPTLFFSSKIYFLVTGMLSASVWVYAMRAQWAWKPEEGIRSPGTGGWKKPTMGAGNQTSGRAIQDLNHWAILQLLPSHSPCSHCLWWKINSSSPHEVVSSGSF